MRPFLLQGWVTGLVGVLLAGCASDNAPLDASGADYAYEPPVLSQPALPSTERERRAPSDAGSPPAAVPAPPVEARTLAGTDRDGKVESDGAAEAEKKKGWFSFLGRKRSVGEEEGGEPVTAAVESELSVDAAAEEAEESIQPAAAIEKVYRLKAGDQVFITLSGSGGLSEQVETVIDEEGGVKLRYIGSVRAAGRTATELEREIEAEYTDRQKIYRELVARVVVPNTYYFIGGEVRQPGRFPIQGRVTLSQAIPAAGNFTEWANERKIVLARGDDRFVIDFREIAHDPTRDVELQPGDVVTVERRSFL